MPFLIPLISLVVGILVGQFFHGEAWGIVPICLAVVFYFFLHRVTKIPVLAFRYNHFHYVWISLVFIGVGMFTEAFHRPLELRKAELDNIIGLEATINSVSTFSQGDKIEATVSRTIDASGRISKRHNFDILINTDGFSAKKGDIVSVKASLMPIADNPNYRSEGYADRMHRAGVFYCAYASSDDIRIKGFSNSLAARSSLWRDRIEAAIEKSSLSRPASDFVIALLLGDDSFVRRDMKESFSNAGVAHILALSGMHVAIIMGMLAALLFPFAFLGRKLISYWIALAGIWCFAFFSGGAPSTIRACIMATFVVISLTFQRRKNPGNALLASSFLIILIDPHAIYDVGLQLSFLSVACILMFATHLNTVNRHSHPKLYLVTSAILVSLSATAGTWVLVSYYFKRIPLLFLPANLIILPFLPLFMGMAIVYVILIMCGHDPHWLAAAIDSGFDGLSCVVDYISSFGSSVIDFKATFPMVLLWITGILVLGYALHKQRTAVAISTACLMLVSSVAIAPLMAAERTDSVIFQKNFRDISMMLYRGNESKKSIIPRKTVGKINFGDIEILSIDCKGASDSIMSWIERSDMAMADMIKKGRKKNLRRYLVIGSGADAVNFSSLPGKEKFEKIILHCSLSRKEEDTIMKEARRSGIQSIHSLRLDGPLEVKIAPIED